MAFHRTRDALVEWYSQVMYGCQPEDAATDEDIEWALAHILAIVHNNHMTAAHLITGRCWNNDSDLQYLKQITAEVAKVAVKKPVLSEFREQLTKYRNT